jgi:pre-mRNA-processing factor 19
MELAAALYKQDAAERTIARLIRERDQAREHARQKGGRQEDEDGVAAMDVDESSASVFSEEQQQRISNAGQQLIAARKSRVLPVNNAKLAEVKALKETQSHNVLKKGLTSVARHAAGSGLAVGAVDGTVLLWENGKTLATLKGHSKAVSAVRFAPGGSGALGSVLSASLDGSVRLWSASSGHSYAASHTFSQLHSAEVSALTVHPCGSFFASASRDSSWALVDLQSSATVYTVKGGAEIGPCSSAVFHPDGFLLATTTEDPKFLLRLWDISSRENVISFPGHTGRINSVAFNENGFYLATGSADHTVKMWDLRNLNEPMFVSEQSEVAVTSVHFDHSGE